MKKFFMTTRGRIRVNRLLLATSVSLSVLSIGLQIYNQANNTSAANTFGNYESLEVEVGELQVRATGKNITEALMNLMKNERRLGTPLINERSFPYTPQKEELILKRQDNSSSILSFPKA
tara:strand:- start:1229 stop:1588 length:360 start_codon:yes stop_codon:yes gene_type:complete